MLTILKGFAVIMVLVPLPLLLITVFSWEVFIGVLLFIVLLIICYLIGLLVEDILD